MELKLFLCYFAQIVNRECLNRTFMELKCSKVKNNIVIILFKSHLYGIEIHTIISIPCTQNPFKSHLYGIEISSTCHNLQTLLGLNRTFMELK